MNNENDINKSVYDTSSSIELKDVINLFWNRKLLICIITVLFTSGAITYSFFLKPEYIADSKFITRTSNSKNSKLGDIAMLTGISLSSSNTVDPSDYLDQVLMDGTFLQEVLSKRWRYKERYVSMQEIFGFIPDTTLPEWEYRFQKNCFEALRHGRYIKLLKDKKNGIITLTTNSPDAVFTKDLNDFCINYLNDYMRSSTKSQAKEKRLFIEKRLFDVKNELEQSENELLNYRQHNISMSSPQLVLAEGRLLRNANINQEIYLQLQKQYELIKLEEMNDQTLIEVIRQSEIPIDRAKPEKKKIAIIGFIMGLMISLSVVLGLNWYKHNYLLCEID